MIQGRGIEPVLGNRRPPIFASCDKVPEFRGAGYIACEFATHANDGDWR
jgi:hypothetical protein